MSEPAVSLILPLPWWQSRLPDLCQELRRIFAPQVGSYELILVTDTADPQIGAHLRNLRKQFPEVHVLFTARRMGDSVALAVAVRAAKAQRLIILDPLLHVAVEDLPRLLEPMEQGIDLVCTWRWPSRTRGPSWITSTMFNALVRLVSQVPVHDLACRTFAVRRQALQDIPLYGDLHRFLPVFLARNGVPWCEVKIRPQRGQPMPKRPSSYMRRFFDLTTLAFLTRFSRRPLHLFGLLGLSSFTVGLLICLRLTYEKLVFHAALSQRPGLFLGVLLIVIGIQIASIGLLGELVIFTQARRVEDYYIRETLE